MQKILLLSCLLLGTVSVIQAQTRQVTGTVTDSSDGSAVPGVNVLARGTAVGTATDNDGKFTIQVPSSSNVLVFSFVGYVTQEVSIDGISNVSVSLQPSSSELEEVVVSVGRGSQRTFTDTPLPVDNFTARDLATTGQFTFDKALQYRVPSFNTVNTPVNDATTLLDPYEVGLTTASTSSTWCSITLFLAPPSFRT